GRHRSANAGRMLGQAANWRAVSEYSKKRNAMTDMPLASDFVTLYRQAFEEYGIQALWNMRAVEKPTPADALAITKALRTHGGMAGRRLAEQIEKACRAPH